MLLDDQGTPWTGWGAKGVGAGDPSVDRTMPRVVSLVPSLTEAIAASEPGALVGITDWCTHPADLAVPRMGGTKNPTIEEIVRCQPDAVVANAEENRPQDIAALREAGLPVYVTDIRTLDQAFSSLTAMAKALGLTNLQWLRQAEAAWAQLPHIAHADAVPVVVPIWRRPWMAIGSDTFTGSLLKRLGYRNILDTSPERYPTFTPGPDSDDAHLVVLPDEPYLFTATDGPEAFPKQRCALVSGRLLTWYGPSLAEAAQVLPQVLRMATQASSAGLPGR